MPKNIKIKYFCCYNYFVLGDKTIQNQVNWQWLRGLFRILADQEDITSLQSKLKESFLDYLKIRDAEIVVIHSLDNKLSEKEQIDKLASSSFFNRNVIEDIFLHKKPCTPSSSEIIFPLEADNRILGLIYFSFYQDFSDYDFEILWSFCDLLSTKISELQLPIPLNTQSRFQIKEISDSVFNNLKSFLEASLERLKVLEEQNIQLVELNKTRTDLINNVSHELRTPLVSIMGFSNILQRHEISQELILEASEQIQQAGSRLSRMIDDLIQLNRASTKGWSISLEKVDLGEIARYVVNSLSPLHKEHNFDFDFDFDYPLIQADRKLIRQVIENLIINSIKYSPQGGQITCRIRVDSSCGIIAFSVVDNGIGMSDLEKLRVFERFYRAKNPQTENISGLGLGLSISKDVVEAMNGTIHCESNYGEGSVFTMSFAYGN